MSRVLLVLIGLMSLQGCSVGWYSLRESNNEISKTEISGWKCPVDYELQVMSSHYTNTFGEKESQPEYIAEIEKQLNGVTEITLKELGCIVSKDTESTKGRTLIINVTEQKFLSALPQEWLTGLSFGVIPSWGTRPEQWKFEFKLGDDERIFVVDDTRFNHLIAFPIFWISFPLMNIESKYEEALREFAKNS